jgi:flagellar biosynthesis/type III secretory pathway protein FliH
VEAKILSNLSKTAKPKAVWRPMDVLKNVNMQNVRFLEKDYSRPSDAKFAIWNANELPSTSTQSLGGTNTDLANTDIETQAKLGGSLPEGASALNKLDPELIESIKQEAFDRGLAEGKQQFAALQDEADKERAQAEAADIEATHQLLSHIEKAIDGLKEVPDQRHEPLKRLAMHLAEQLVLVELSLSPNAVQALVERCIETLDITPSAAVVVELNPSDMALLQTRVPDPGEEKPTWRLQADPTLLPGSVRVRADDAVVSDLVEHRLESLAQSLLTEPKRWQAQTAFHPERLNSRRGQAGAVEDALPRESFSKDTLTSESAQDEFEDVLDAEPTATGTSTETLAKPKGFGDIDLPDLELPAATVADNTEPTDAPHE